MTEAKENVIEITFNGKPIKGVELADGVVRRATRSGATSCMVRCSVTGKWCYCSDERLTKKAQAMGSIEDVGHGYISRDGLKQIKQDAEAAEAKLAEVEV